VPVLVGDSALLLVRLDEHARVADEVRVALGQDELDRLRVHEGDEPEHALLLARDTHVVQRPVDAASALYCQERKRGSQIRSRSSDESIASAVCMAYLK
jgi:hypothetical protein